MCAELGFPLIFGTIQIFIVYFVQHIRAIKIASSSQLLYLQAIFGVNVLIFIAYFILKHQKRSRLLHNYLSAEVTNL